ncbi:MAG: NYN domain-containing protein, partial [Thermoanaerobaculia bacterium]
MSPWWLRPPGEENEENAPEPAGRETAEERATDVEHGRSEAPRTPSIADLVGDRPAREESSRDAEEEERRAAPQAEETGHADDAGADDDSGDGGEGGDADAGEPQESEGGEPAERPRRRRRRGGRGRGRGGASNAAAGGATPGGGRSAAPPEWDDEDDDEEEQDSEALAREILMSMPVAVHRAAAAAEEERKIALFCDLENVALGVRDSEIKKFDIHLVLERLVEKGKIIVKRAYADWDRYSEFKVAFHEAAVELIEIPQRRYTGKNSADIKMVVDAMDLSYSKEHLDTFVLLSGDSDFSPLVSKLRENAKQVIGLGVKQSTSDLLIANCDEFIFY